MIITRKIQINFSEDDKERRNELWRFLYKLQDDVFAAANTILNHQFYNEIHKERHILGDMRQE
jgi:hypothetical protein